MPSQTFDQTEDGNNKDIARHLAGYHHNNPYHPQLFRSTQPLQQIDTHSSRQSLKTHSPK